MLRQNRLWLSGMALLALGLGCGIAIRRDLSTVPPGQVGFDDMCGLQEYFDALEIKSQEYRAFRYSLILSRQSRARRIGRTVERLQR